MGEEIVSLEKIHYQFWNEFVNKVFNDSEFKNDFNYRKSWNKSYYKIGRASCRERVSSPV